MRVLERENVLNSSLCVRERERERERELVLVCLSINEFRNEKGL